MNGDGSSRSMTYSLPSLFKLINQQDAIKGNELAQLQQTLLELKKNISMTSKKNFTLERDIRTLDKKIALLIRNKITIEDIMTNSGDLSLLNKTGQLKNKRDRELYGELFWLLQNDTRYIATLARLVNIGQIDNLLQTVMFTLYGNQYDEYEEHLLLSMFRSVLDYEFQQATGIGSLLRANTALTRMMTTYTRRGPGQAYLKNTLTDVLGQFCALPDVLEVNPLKVYIEYINDFEMKTGQKSPLNRKVTAEEAAQNDEVQKIIKPRIEKLDEIAAQFIDALIKSTDSIPYGIRWICKQISELVKEKFPDVTREQVCSLIGGFYLLRFINPAIVTPQAFMLVDTKLSANTRRNLTLLAKILQNLANNVKFGGVKEFYMAPLNICIDKNKERLNRFLEEMTHVENLEQHLNLDRYIALGRTDENSINISFNEMYFIHELLIAHKDELLQGGDNEHFKKLLERLGDPPAQIARKDNANIDLVLSQSWKDDAEAQSGKLAPEQIYAETKFLLFTIIKALPVENMEQLAKQSLDETLLMAKKYAQQTSNKGLTESVKRINKNCADLVKVGYLNENDNYAQLRKDAVQELYNYEEQIEKTKGLIARLDEVLQNVEQHRKFLSEQYDAYKSYLDDVRGKCAVSGNQNQDTKKKKQKKESGKVAGPYKYTYLELEKAGIIKSSQVPKERRAHIVFHFSSPSPGMYSVAVSWRGKKLPNMTVALELADLLERQQEGRLDFETDFLTLDVNLLLHLLNKHFVSGKK